MRCLALVVAVAGALDWVGPGDGLLAQRLRVVNGAARGATTASVVARRAAAQRERLEADHRALDARVRALDTRRTAGYHASYELQKLKKLKLRAKDALARLDAAVALAARRGPRARAAAAGGEAAARASERSRPVE